MYKNFKIRSFLTFLLTFVVMQPARASVTMDAARKGIVLAKRYGPILKRVGKYAALVSAVGLSAWFVSALWGNTSEDLTLFFQEVAKNPAEMGAGFPCSKYLAKSSVAHLPRVVEGKELNVLEVGAGTGIVTQELVRVMKRRGMRRLETGCCLDVVELQQPLCDVLQEKFGRIQGVNVHCTPVEKFNPGKKYDAIVMTVPFNSLPHALVKEIWTHIMTLLKDGGTISYVSYLGLPALKKVMLNKREKRDFQKTLDMLDNLHAQHGAGQDIVVRNVPPIRVRYFEVEKPSVAALAA